MKPKRHVIHVADLTTPESTELGSVVQQVAEVVTRLERPDQVYVTLLSHMDAVPGHIHFVVHPVTKARMDEHDGKHGVRLQVEIDRRVFPDPSRAASFAERARRAWEDRRGDMSSG